MENLHLKLEKSALHASKDMLLDSRCDGGVGEDWRPAGILQEEEVVMS